MGWMVKVVETLVFCAFGMCAQESAIRIPIQISAPAAGLVSLALLDTNGAMVRNLLCAQPVSAGASIFFWDGTSDNGLPVAPALRFW